MIEQLTPDYWHAKAQEVRAQADELQDPDARSTMLQLAMMCSGMALRMEERLAEKKATA